MKRNFSTPRLLLSALILAGGLVVSLGARAHGDAAPQPVDTGSLPKLGNDLKEANPFESGPDAAEALRVGRQGYTANCARCHGLEAVSGGIAPDLRKVNADCGPPDKRDKACIADMDQYFAVTVRKGRTRDGRVYMPGFEEIMSQEAVWAIRSYVNSRKPD